MKSLVKLGYFFSLVFLVASCGSRRNTQTCDPYYGCTNGQSYYTNGQNTNAINTNNSVISFDQLKADFNAKYTTESAALGNKKFSAVVYQPIPDDVVNHRTIREYIVTPTNVVINDYKAKIWDQLFSINMNGADLLSQIRFNKGSFKGSSTATKAKLDAIFASTGSYAPRVTSGTKQLPGFGIVNVFYISKSNGEVFVVSKDLPYYLNPIEFISNYMPENTRQMMALIQE